MSYKTEQEAFWAGEFGSDYCKRNAGDQWVANNTAFFAKILARTQNVSSVIEFGSNTGLNLKALANLLPDAELSAIEINAEAVAELEQWGRAKQVFHQSILDFEAGDARWDMTFIKGVLIHINPDALDAVYQRLYECSSRYIVIAEYYNPTPVTIEYRGHSGKLFKRDFAGEMMDKYPDLQLLDYGFCWHRDPVFPQGDITWFLFEKK